MLTVCVSCWVAHLDLCGLSVCPRLKRIAQPGGRDAPASPSLPTDSPAVETSSHSPSYTHGIICLPKHHWDDAEARLIFPLGLTWASLTSSCLYLLTMSLVRFSRKPDTVSNSWSTENTNTFHGHIHCWIKWSAAFFSLSHLKVEWISWILGEDE